MRYVSSAGLAVLSMLAPAMLLGQPLSITNYVFVSQQSITQTQTRITYHADLVNSGGPLGSVTATVSSSNIFSVRTVPGADTLTFSPVPANSQITASATFTILVSNTQTFSFSSLQWAFQSTPVGPTANAGPSQSVSVGNLVTLNGSGSTNPSGVGTLTYSWQFTSRPPGTSTFLSHSQSVNPSFIADVQGNYVITLTVSNGSLSSSASVTVSTLNSPPVANAGANQTAKIGATVGLNGSGSSDVDGDSLTYQWSLTTVPSGSTATLSGANTVLLSFVVDKPGSYVATLTVSDGHGNSGSATVTITTTNTPPVANAGAAQIVSLDAPVQLNGSGSSDVDGDPLTYQWSLIALPTGSAAALDNPTAVNPTFTADVTGVYVAQLTVNDSHANSAPATVSIATNTILPPTANAGPDQTLNHSSQVCLNGYSWSDPQGLPLTHQWTVISKPASTTASVVESNSPGCSTYLWFTPSEAPGTYVVQLIVNNGFLNSAPSTVTITTTNIPPVANAGPNQGVISGATVTLDGSGSSDADSDPITYSWSLLKRPDNSLSILVPLNVVSPKFLADLEGTYIAQLIVNDGFSDSIPSTVTIVAAAPPPITLGPSPLNLVTNASASLTVTLPAPAGTGGQVVALKSTNPTAATVPPSVTVPQGSLTASVTVTPASAGATTIQATAAGFTTGAATVNVANIQITLTPNPLNLVTIGSGSITMTLSAPAGAGGQVINLASTITGVATVPPSVTVPQGSSTANITVTPAGSGSTTIVASAAGFTVGAATVNVSNVQITLTPNPLSLVTIGSGSITMTLSAPAGTGGQVINLASSNTGAATVPLSVTVPQGSSTANITVTPVAGGSTTITASAPGFTAGTATVNVSNVQITLTPNPLNLLTIGSGSITVSLSAPAGSGGQIVNLASSNTSAATVPLSVTVPPGSTTTTAVVTPTGAGSTTITASASGTGFTPGTTTVNVSKVQIALAPNPLNMGNDATATLTVTLSAPAGASGQVINLASNNSSTASVPATVTVLSGATTATATVTPGSAGSATITASASGSAFTPGTATVNVVNVAQILVPINMTVTPGQTATFSVTLANPAPAGGLFISLASSDTSKLTVSPANIQVPAGSKVPTVTPKITGVDFGSPTITASAIGLTSASQQVHVSATVSFFPSAFTITGATRKFVSVILSAPAPANGVTINLSSDNTGVATVPSSVVFAAGATSATVAITGVATGSTLIHASASPNIPDATASVTVQ